MTERSQAEIGAACVAIFVVGSAFRGVYLGHVFQSVSVYLVLLIPLGIATVAGLCIPRAKGESLRFVLHSPRDVVHGAMPKNLAALANLESLDFFKHRRELKE